MRGQVELVGLVGPATYSRGLTYAQDGRVRITQDEAPYAEGKPAAERGKGYLEVLDELLDPGCCGAVHKVYSTEGV